MQIKNIKTNVVLSTDNENASDDIGGVEFGPTLVDSAIMIPAFNDYAGYSYQALSNRENNEAPGTSDTFDNTSFFEERLQRINPSITLDEDSDWVSILTDKLPDYDIYELGISEHSAVAFSAINIRDHHWSNTIDNVDGILITAKGKYTNDEIHQYTDRLGDFFNGWFTDVKQYSLDEDHRYQDDGYVGYIYNSDVPVDIDALDTPAKQTKAIKNFLDNLIVTSFDEIDDLYNVENWKLTQERTIQIIDFE